MTDITLFPWKIKNVFRHCQMSFPWSSRNVCGDLLKGMAFQKGLRGWVRFLKEEVVMVESNGGEGRGMNQDAKVEKWWMSVGLVGR
jgi:hypothetical protein